MPESNTEVSAVSLERQQVSDPDELSTLRNGSRQSSSYGDIDDFFKEDPTVVQASIRIRNILYRRRERQIAQWPPIRRHLHILFYEPSSIRARVYMGFSTAVVLFFLIVFMIDTMPQYRVWAHWRDIARSVNLATAIFFAVEWALRFYAFRHPLKYLIQPLTILDMLGIVPGFIYFYDDRANFLGRAKWLRALQVLRVLRVLRLTEYSVELYVTLRTLRKSLFQILVVMMVIAIILLTSCFLMFFAENDRLDEVSVQWLRKNHGVTEPSPFQNVFFCFYWGFATITTVGYGDYTPVSPWGQVIASISMFLGVFTIVFPTSIISNNFSTEWEAFHKAQKLHEQRLLQNEYEHKKRDLARVWSYANRSYDQSDHGDDANSPEGGILSEGSPNTVNAISEKTSVHSPDSLSRLYVSDSKDSSGVNNTSQDLQYANQSRNIMHPSSRYSTDVELDAQLISKTNGRMAPFEYDRIIEITKKVEKNLGIPGVSLDEINTDSEVNQSLVVNAMYSKLYNDAFNSLCQRMLACLLSQRKFGSVDEVASFLQHNPAAHNASAEHLRNEKLTMLEYKLLCYVFENVSQSNYPIPEPHCSGDDSAANPSDQTVSKSLHTSNRRGLRKEPCRSSPNLRDYGRRPVIKTAKQRIKSKIAHAYQHLPMSREQTHQSVHNFMESAIAHDSVGTSQPNKPSKLRFHLHNQPSINKKDIGPPIPMRRSVSTGIVNPPTRTPHSDSSLHNTSDEETHTKSEETQDSPGIKINIQPSSD